VKRVLLVYPGYIVREQPLNVLYVAAAVRAAGHAVAFFDVTPFRKRPLRGDPFRPMKEAFEGTIDAFRPDVVGFSVMSVNYLIAATLAGAAKAKRPEVLTIFGGIHPTIAPEKTIQDPVVDVICRGEGEGSMTDLLAALDAGADHTAIAGLWVKKDGQITRNPVRPLEQGLDGLPFPARDLLDRRRLRAELYGINMLSSRGCPFPCAYCQNEYLMDLYRGRGRFVRYRSLDNVFAEIDEIIGTYHPSRLSFSDESFTLHKARLAEFCERYAKRYSIPFLCQTRPDLVDEEVVRTLRAGGCDFINMAIESGNPEIRNGVLGRDIPTGKIAEAFSLARRYGIRTGSFNMIGLPKEDMPAVWDTIRLNKRLQPDRIMCTVYMPFLGTKLGEDCIRDGWLEHPIDDAEVYYTNIAINHPGLSAKTLFGYQGFFDYYVRFPKALYPAIHALRRIYQLLPRTNYRLSPLIRAAREGIINLVYDMKRILPSRGFFMKTR
jgi:anaerobic magnesium-protoporphyrin IX monomethyl ester cyclase